MNHEITWPISPPPSVYDSPAIGFSNTVPNRGFSTILAQIYAILCTSNMENKCLPTSVGVSYFQTKTRRSFEDGANKRGKFQKEN